MGVGEGEGGGFRVLLWLGWEFGLEIPVAGWNWNGSLS